MYIASEVYIIVKYTQEKARASRRSRVMLDLTEVKE